MLRPLGSEKFAVAGSRDTDQAEGLEELHSMKKESEYRPTVTATALMMMERQEKLPERVSR